MKKEKIKISTPGRICLFGEHQDYLGLPIIASAISKRIFIEGIKQNDKEIRIDLPDIKDAETITLNGLLSYKKEQDYYRSSLNVLLKEGYSFSNGFDCVVKGDIPINSGTSSSSALIVTWINFLLRMSDQSVILSAEEIAEYAHRAEVLEFSEPGGMMDHYSTSVGNIIWLESVPKIKLEKINSRLGAFVLSDSREPKDTKAILTRVKQGVLNIVNELRKINSEFSLHSIRLDEIEEYKKYLSNEQYELLGGTVKNRDITTAAKKVFETIPLDGKKIGILLNDHHKILRDVLRISTSKIDRMIDAALSAGAYGAKINGSGGGGCMFAYAPENPEKVLKAVKMISNDSFVVYSDEGTREEK
jgi:galactokinase